MTMKRITLVMTLLIMASAIIHGQVSSQPQRQDKKTEQEVRATLQELIDAGRRKDRAAYERLLADGFTFIHATGAIETRQEYLDHAVSGTQLFQRADSQTLDERINVYEGRTAVWTSHSAWRNRAITARPSSVAPMCSLRAADAGSGPPDNPRGYRHAPRRRL